MLKLDTESKIPGTTDDRCFEGMQADMLIDCDVGQICYDELKGMILY